MKFVDNSVDFLILKWTFTAAFLGVTAIFVGKIGFVLWKYLHTQWVAFQQWVHDPELMHHIGSWIWQAIKAGAGS